MTSRPSLHELQDDALLQAALRRYSAQQPPTRSAWTYRLAVLGFVLGGAAFVMEAVSLSGGVGLSVAEPAAARSMWLNSSYSNRFRSIWQNSTLRSLTVDQPAATTPNASAPPEPASPTAPEARSQAPASDDPTPPTPVLMLAAADATVEGLPPPAGASGATFQALWEEAKQQTANRSMIDPREAAGGASGAAAVDGGVAGEEEPVPERGDRPNLLLMVADDLAASDLTSYRKQGVGGLVHGLTPNLDGIARKGALFMQAHSVAPLCTPARFALLTGVQPACGLLEEGAPPQNTAAPPPLVSGETYLAPHHRTLPHKLRRLGYTTGLVGLWHLGTPESNAGKKLSRQVPNAQCPMPNAKCQMPNAQCPMPSA